ncbi:hypothetical protein D3C86_2135800 [compost metagenome]
MQAKIRIQAIELGACLVLLRIHGADDKAPLAIDLAIIQPVFWASRLRIND